MENFYLYVSKPVEKDEFDFWLDTNNICYNKLELYRDFTISLIQLIYKTYLGDETLVETNIWVSRDDDMKHFDWCWNKTIENFEKEKIFFERKGEHYEFFKGFLDETFYIQSIKEIKLSLDKFFDEVFNMDTSFTKSDLDLLTTIYKWDRVCINVHRTHCYIICTKLILLIKHV
jgi:hypothetical protein